ncbi:TlpA disulfide reductase family protein [Rhodocytophaga aerolata]|uniref:TlpA disulfide reductase family protein n=1 Tax=Rhodocytophaga aerolata TaxID=455078 RepID=A0ABT8R5V9_9BACT|nr:TlpA disulfide reductase family protein [Rhodocytophaga aerolata]MDO1447480.1 TlpA disulfide reductase family protein [Rhodocytophaga aerolata]
MKKIWKSEITSWAVMLTVILTLYLTGLHTEVIGRVQQVFLSTGLLKPSVDHSLQELPAQVQQPIYDIPLAKLNGEKVNMKDFAGKVVFINLWATWCPPCIAEMPSIHKLYEQIDTSHIQFVMLTLDEDLEKAKKFIDRKGYTFPVYATTQEMPSAFATSSIPTTFVLSPNGKIVLRKEGMAKYNTEEFKNFLTDLSKSAK